MVLLLIFQENYTILSFYGVDKETGILDYDKIEEIAKRKT